MNAYSLPTSIDIGGKEFQIRSDFRAILDILQAQNDPDLDDQCKVYVMLSILYVDVDEIDQQHIEEAITKAIEFIDAGHSDDPADKPTLMDWEQDAKIIIPAINKVAGTEVRALPYLHWWSFLGYYMEIGESFFSTVVSLRDKKRKGKKLEKHEAEFYRENKAVVDLKKKTEQRSEEEKDALRALFGFNKR